MNSSPKRLEGVADVDAGVHLAFRRDIQGLRALAVVLVVLYHARVGVISGGFVGVDVFFVLSGFLITGLLLKELDDTGSIRLFDFYAKRARRLLPASFTVLAAIAAVLFVVPRWFPEIVLPQVQGRSISWDIQRSALYIVNWLFAERSVSYQGLDSVGSPVLHFWSLSIEEQFYAVWPLLLLGVAVVAGRRRWALGAAMAVVTVASLWASYRVTANSPDAAYFVSTTRAWEMSLGGLGAMAAPTLVRLANRSELLHQVLFRVAIPVGIVAIGSAAMIFDEATPYPGLAALLPTTATLLVLLGGCAGPVGSRTRILDREPLQWLGARSYSLYLWHWPAIWLATAIVGPLTVTGALVAVGLSVVPAMVSYRWIETPFRVGRAARLRPAYSLGAAAAVSVAGYALGFMLLSTTTNVTDLPIDDGQPVTEVAGIQLSAETLAPKVQHIASDFPEGYASDCYVSLNEFRYHECSTGNPSSETTVLLLGNSQIAQWGPAVEALATEEDWHVISVVHDGCRIASELATTEQCRDWVADVWENVPRLVDDADVDLVLTSTFLVVGEHEFARTEEALVSVYSELATLDTTVAMIEPFPKGLRIALDCPPRFAECAIDRSTALFGAEPSIAAARRAGLARIDMTPFLCNDDVCPAVIDSYVVRRDDAHMTRTFSQALATPLGRELETLVPALFAGSPLSR